MYNFLSCIYGGESVGAEERLDKYVCTNITQHHHNSSYREVLCALLQTLDCKATLSHCWPHT